MRHCKLAAGAIGVSVSAVAAIGAVGAAGASGAAPSKVVVKQKFSVKMVPNRYVQDGMRFDRDVYTVKSGGTVELRMTAPQEGPHTLTVVAPKDAPKNAGQVFNCKVCNKLAKAHGADPNSNAPPKLQVPGERSRAEHAAEAGPTGRLRHRVPAEGRRGQVQGHGPQGHDPQVHLHRAPVDAGHIEGSVGLAVGGPRYGEGAGIGRRPRRG